MRGIQGDRYTLFFRFPGIFLNRFAVVYFRSRRNSIPLR